MYYKSGIYRVCVCSLRRESPRLTAARECSEETLGILGNASELAAALIDFKTNNSFKVYAECSCRAYNYLYTNVKRLIIIYIQM